MRKDVITMTESKLISRADVEHVAKLAHLSFDEAETADCIDKQIGRAHV